VFDPIAAWMSVSVYSVLMFSCIERGLETYQMSKDSYYHKIILNLNRPDDPIRKAENEELYCS
jgi:hypothetical protein